MIEPIIFSFSPNASDYYKTLRAVMFRNRTTKAIMLVGMLILGCSGLTSIAITHTFQTAAITLLILFLLILTFYFLGPATAAEKVTSEERLNTETTWVVDEEKVSIKTKFAETSLDWGSFGVVYETRDHYMITYSTNKNMFQIIPRRAFSSTNQEGSFRNLLVAKTKSITRINSVNLPELSKRTTLVLLFTMLAIFIIITVFAGFFQASN